MQRSLLFFLEKKCLKRHNIKERGDSVDEQPKQRSVIRLPAFVLAGGWYFDRVVYRADYFANVSVTI